MEVSVDILKQITPRIFKILFRLQSILLGLWGHLFPLHDTVKKITEAIVGKTPTSHRANKEATPDTTVESIPVPDDEEGKIPVATVESIPTSDDEAKKMPSIMDSMSDLKNKPYHLYDNKTKIFDSKKEEQ